MKIRCDFVTNSSSSSYICVSKINNISKLLEFFKEEYGRYGVNLLNTYLKKGSNIKTDWQYEQFIDYCDDNIIDIEDDDLYLLASFISYSNEGDTEGDDAWLYRHIPSEFKEEIYEEDY